MNPLREACLDVLRRKNTEMTAAEIIQELAQARYRFNTKSPMGTVSATLHSLVQRGELASIGTSKKLYRLPGKSPNRAMPRPVITGDETLLTFVQKMGGLALGSDLRGERKHFMSSLAGRRPGLFPKKARLAWEEMIQAANDEGYGPFETETAFFNAIDDECRGLRTYHSANRDWDKSLDQEWERYADDLARRGICAHCGQALPESEVTANDYRGI
jgi:hypothetical protein